jgi:hypothetical protein
MPRQDVAYSPWKLKMAAKHLETMAEMTDTALRDLHGVNGQVTSAMRGELFDDLGARYGSVMDRIVDIVRHTARYQRELRDATRTMVRRYVEAEDQAMQLMDRVLRELDGKGGTTR